MEVIWYVQFAQYANVLSHQYVWAQKPCQYFHLIVGSVLLFFCGGKHKLRKVRVICPCDMLQMCDQRYVESEGWRRQFDIIWAFGSLQHLTRIELHELLRALHFCTIG